MQKLLKTICAAADLTAKALAAADLTAIVLAAAVAVGALLPFDALAAATTPIPENLVDLTTSSAGCLAGYSESSEYYPTYKAFDNGSKSADGSRWLATKADNMYVTYKFKVATVVNGIGIFLPTLNYNCGARAPNTWTFSGSNDGETWTTLDTQSGETGWTDGEFRYYQFSNSDEYLYYKFNCTANNGATDYMQVQEIEFYGPEQDLPVFTDLTTSSAGSATEYSTVYANSIKYNGTKAFDDGDPSDTESRFLAQYNANGMYVTYKFNTATAVNGIGIQLPFENGSDYSERAPNTWTFSGSNDGENWTTLDRRTGEDGWSKGEFRHYEFRARMPFEYYKFNCTALNGSTVCMQISELEFYYSEPDGPDETTWTGAGDTDFLDDNGNWDSGVPGLSTLATIVTAGSKDAVVPSEPMAIRQLHLGSGGSAVLRQTNGMFAVTNDVRLGCANNATGMVFQTGGTFHGKDIFVGYETGGVGRYEMTGGTLSATSRLGIGRFGHGTFSASGDGTVVTAANVRVGFTISGDRNKGYGTFIVTNGAEVATTNICAGAGKSYVDRAKVVFDGAVLTATAASAEFLKDLPDVTLGAGGLTINTQGKNLGINNCTFNVTGNGKITVVGGGTVTFTDVTLNLSAKPSGTYVFAETDGTFSGLPNLGGVKGCKISLSYDCKRVMVIPRRFIITVF